LRAWASRWRDSFAAAGSDSLLVHWEGNNNLHRTVQRIRMLGKRAGIVINPATPAAVLEGIVCDVDQVLVMTVNPGFGHQQFLRTTLPKIERVRERIGSGRGASWKWMAASTRSPCRWSFAPAPPCSWQARPSSATAAAWPLR
jgi:pentose-5-phosphate-3-epimerase